MLQPEAEDLSDARESEKISLPSLEKPRHTGKDHRSDQISLPLGWFMKMVAKKNLREGGKAISL